MPRPLSDTRRTTWSPHSTRISTDDAPACRATFESASRSTGRSSCAIRSSMASTGPSKRMRGSNPSASRSSSVMRSTWARTPPVSRASAWRLKMTDRISRIVSSRSSTTAPSRRPCSASAVRAETGLDGHAGGEELLDDDVVEVAGDAFAVFDDAQVLLGLVQALLGFDPLAYVTHDLDVALRGAVVARDRLHEDLDRHIGAVAVAMHGRERHRGLLAPGERTRAAHGAGAR